MSRKKHNKHWLNSKRWLAAEEADTQELRQHMARCATEPIPTISKLLEVSNEYFTASAVWTRRDNVWSCTAASPILSWMKTTPYDKVQVELLRRSCKWFWRRPQTCSDGPQRVNPALNRTQGLETNRARSTNPPSSEAGRLDSAAIPAAVSLQTGC